MTLSDVLRTLRDSGTAATEIGGAIAGGMLTQPAAGIWGLAEGTTKGLMRGKPFGPAARKGIEDVQEAGNKIFAPKSDIGQRGLENVAKGIETVTDPIYEYGIDPIGMQSPALGAGLAAGLEFVGSKGKPKATALSKALREKPVGFDLPDAPLQGVDKPVRSSREVAARGREGAVLTPDERAQLSVPTAKAVFGVNPTVRSPNKIANPGIYRDPRVLADEAQALANKGPESAALKDVWGTSRAELADIAGKREGNIADPLAGIKAAQTNMKGPNATASKVMVPENTQRILDILREGQKRAPGLMEGMQGWYVSDPMFKRLVELVGPEEAVLRFNRLNLLNAAESPNMPVPDEIRRGAAANFMNEQNRWPEWVQHGSAEKPQRAAAGALQDIQTLPGRVGSRAANQTSVIEGKGLNMNSPKVPLYGQASGVPETGVQTNMPVGDAHFSRIIGLPDVRTAKNFNASITMPELRSINEWFGNIAKESGGRSVDTQAKLWGLGAPQTGVTTPIGAPKIELIADRIAKVAAERGISPQTLRDQYLLGKSHLGKIDPDLLKLMGGGAAAAATTAAALREYQPEPQPQ